MILSSGSSIPLLWEPRRDAGLPSRDSSDAADRSIGSRPHAATPDSHLIVAVFPSRIAALHPPMERGMGAAALETERLFFRLEFIGLAGYPNVLVWGPSGWAFDYPFADWRGPTVGWGNP
jgi:hypothetical protein